MKAVYGSGKNALMVGVTLVDGRHMPFFGLIDSKLVPNKGIKCDEFIKLADESGGVVIYVENQDAAETLHGMLSTLFSAAVDTDWADSKEPQGAMQ